MVSRSKAVSDDTCVKVVHPCRVNKTIRIAVSAVMDYLERLAGLLDLENLNWILFKLAKISVSALACFIVGSRERHHGGVLLRETWIDGLMYASYLKSVNRS